MGEMTQDEMRRGYSSADAIAIVADKWAIEMLHALRNGHNRHSMMLRAIPEITRKMLAQTLRRLQRNGIIERTDYGETPPRVEYSITPAGHALIARLMQMCEWSKAHFGEVEQARVHFDQTQID
jgi:DNA-binding HxlR family transcriptional regulator